MEIVLNNIESLKTRKRDRKYQMGVGNCHAFLMLRKDMVDHLTKVHEMTGIKYLRFHGLFDDDMLIIKRLSDNNYYKRMPFSKDIYEYNFLNVKKVFDNVLKCGFKPFVELSFMPKALAKGKKVGLNYNNNICLPKDWNEYYKFIQDFGNFIIEQYGKEEVESWKFEVWNEPDLGIFFNGKQKDYFKLYEYAYKALKSVNPNLKVGGPSTSKCKWLKDFVKFGETNNCKPDFVSTHHYPGDAFGNVFAWKDVFNIMKTAYNAKKNKVDIPTVLTQFFFKKDEFKKWPKSILREMDKSARAEVGDYPLYITEWSTMAVFASPYHDEKIEATSIVKYALEMDHIDGAFYWCASDLFEEQVMINKPFFGGFGMINNVGIPKPVLYAFNILKDTYDDEVILDSTQAEEIEYRLFKKDENFQLLVFNQDYDYDKKEEHKITIKLKGEFKDFELKRIDDNHCNPKKNWQEMGEPKVLKDNEIADIINMSKLKNENINVHYDNGYTIIELVMKTNDLYFYEFKK